MEVPILLAMDTTENWNKSNAVLGKSELAIEIYTRPDRTRVKHLLVGDGETVGPSVERLRAKPELIAGLWPRIEELVAQAVAAEATARKEADAALQSQINTVKEAIELWATAGDAEGLAALILSEYADRLLKIRGETEEPYDVDEEDFTDWPQTLEGYGEQLLQILGK